ncbi:MAG: ATP synthase F0 subunit C [Ruminococcaceae bacterium]|nr:ATP synthase F0 subunit C [Oscillospiraceae bacterium]
MAILFTAFASAICAEEAAPVEQAQTEETSVKVDSTGIKAIAAAITIAVVSAIGAIAMGKAIERSVEGISRQPEAEGKIRTSLMLGLVFVETAIIYALIIAVLIIFVL